MLYFKCKVNRFDGKMLHFAENYKEVFQMATVSFHQNVVIKDPKTIKRLKEEMKSPKSDRPDITPSNTAKEKERFNALWGSKLR